MMSPLWRFRSLVDRRMGEREFDIRARGRIASEHVRMSMPTANVIGAGLAGSEAAWQLARRGVAVRLHEMRPARMTEAHQTSNFAELVCSNSLRGASLETAVGVLKEEMRRLGSLVIAAADKTQVPPVVRWRSIAKASRASSLR